MTPKAVDEQVTVVPGRVSLSTLTIATYALDGAARGVHIRPYPSAERRTEIRDRSYETGDSLPPGGQEQITSATSTVALAMSYRPVR